MIDWTFIEEAARTVGNWWESLDSHGEPQYDFNDCDKEWIEFINCACDDLEEYFPKSVNMIRKGKYPQKDYHVINKEKHVKDFIIAYNYGDDLKMFAWGDEIIHKIKAKTGQETNGYVVFTSLRKLFETLEEVL